MATETRAYDAVATVAPLILDGRSSGLCPFSGRPYTQEIVLVGADLWPDDPRSTDPSWAVAIVSPDHIIAARVVFHAFSAADAVA